MGWFEGFPFISKEERERRRKEFEKRVTPFGVEKQREKLRAVLKELFPNIDPIDLLFTFFDAKDVYTRKDTQEEGRIAAQQRLRKTKWVDKRSENIMLRLLELEIGITSLDDYPTAKDVISGLSD